jgi:hypothetical protein
VKVKDAIALLTQCDPEAELVVNIPFRGFEEANVVLRQEKHRGVGNRYSFEEIKTVEITKGSFAHMLGQGMDVLALGDTPPPCTCNTCRTFQQSLKEP